MVPTHLYKVIYDPHANTAGAYLVANENTKEWKDVSVDEVSQMAGIDLLPAVSTSVKQVAMELPAPKLRSSSYSYKRKGD
jgi:endonuclease G